MPLMRQPGLGVAFGFHLKLPALFLVFTVWGFALHFVCLFVSPDVLLTLLLYLFSFSKG